jgi:hypothetical protein
VTVNLDFSTYITDRTKDFTGRDWIFAEINDWLADPKGSCFFIITGEPGIGKSAVAARLTQVRDLAAYHFCIARQADTINPLLFARSVSQQLCRLDGFAAAILKDSNVELSISPNIRANYGQVIGAKIENLLVNAPSASTQGNRVLILRRHPTWTTKSGAKIEPFVPLLGQVASRSSMV